MKTLAGEDAPQRSFHRHLCNRRGVLLLGVVGASVLLLCWFRVRVPTSDLEPAPAGIESKTTVTGPIYSGIAVRQEISALDAEISGVELRLATYARRNRGHLTLRVERLDGSNWTSLAEKKPAKQSLIDNTYRRFRFSPPLKVRPGQRVAFVLTADGPSSHAITWWIQEGWSPSGTRLSVNQTSVQGMAHMRVFYRGVPLLFHLGALWKRISLFMGPVGTSMFLLGVLLSFSGSMAMLVLSLEEALGSVESRLPKTWRRLFRLRPRARQP